MFFHFHTWEHNSISFSVNYKLLTAGYEYMTRTCLTCGQHQLFQKNRWVKIKDIDEIQYENASKLLQEFFFNAFKISGKGNPCV